MTKIADMRKALMGLLVVASCMIAAQTPGIGNFIDDCLKFMMSQPVITPPVFIPMASRPFTPTHTFFLAASGCNDANSGTSAGSPWCSPNHAVSCGDVLIAAAGDYSAMDTGTWGTVSNCPSTTGGIDGTGGIQFAVLLCGGVDLEACHTSGSLWQIATNHWAVEGFKISSTCVQGSCGAGDRAFNFDGCGALVHHLAAINNVMYNVSSAVHSDDCGTPGTSPGVDYFAGVGNIGVMASLNTSNCEAAFDGVGVGSLDQNAGTHVYFYNNYTWNNQALGGCTGFADSESFMFDTWDAHANVSFTGVIANNISWNAQRYCINFDGGTTHTITPTFLVYNNTCFHNLTNIGADSASAEINNNVGLSTWTFNVFNNISFSNPGTSGSGGPTYAWNAGFGPDGGSISIPGKLNIFKGSASSCFQICDAGNNVNVDSSNNTLPTGIFVNPGFTNTTDLLNNRSGNTPNCAGFVNTTQCMGYNAITRTLTTPSVISDLQPDPNCGSVANQCVGKGFQLPSIVCASSGDVFNDYPTYLKGVVYLRVVNGQVFQYHDLATTKCNL